MSAEQKRQRAALIAESNSALASAKISDIGNKSLSDDEKKRKVGRVVTYLTQACRIIRAKRKTGKSADELLADANLMLATAGGKLAEN